MSSNAHLWEMSCFVNYFYNFDPILYFYKNYFCLFTFLQGRGNTRTDVLLELVGSGARCPVQWDEVFVQAEEFITLTRDQAETTPASLDLGESVTQSILVCNYPSHGSITQPEHWPRATSATSVIKTQHNSRRRKNPKCHPALKSRIVQSSHSVSGE